MALLATLKEKEIAAKRHLLSFKNAPFLRLSAKKNLSSILLTDCIVQVAITSKAIALSRMHYYQNNEKEINGDSWTCLYNNIQTLLEVAHDIQNNIEVPTLHQLVSYFHGVDDDNFQVQKINFVNCLLWKEDKKAIVI